MKKKEKVQKTDTFAFGGLDLTVINQQDDLIPTHAENIHLLEEHAQCLALAIQADLPTLLIGETGTGKTSVIRYLAFKRQQGYTRINMHGYNTPDELIGSKSVKGGATYYENGILTNAMLKGHIVVLDELNATPPDCTFIIHGLLDDDKRIALPNGDVIRPHKDFRFFATMNPDYEGTRSLNRAFMDRFSIVLNVDILPPDQEQVLLTTRTNVAKDLAEKMVQIAWLGRKAYREHKTMMMISTRTLLQWAYLMTQGVENSIAYNIAVVNKAHVDEKEAFTDFFNLIFNTKANDKKAREVIHFVTKGELLDWQADLQKARAELKTMGDMKAKLEQELLLVEQQKKVDQSQLDQANQKLKDYEEMFKQIQEKINF